MKRSLLGFVSFVALGAGLSAPAFADQAASAGAAAAQDQGGIQDIVVTAQKRAENVQSVPIAISAFTAEAIKERAVADVSSLSAIAPNVTLDAGTPFSGSSSVLSAFIRGIGANDFAFNIDPGVGIYLDGVYLARSIGANQELSDIERIEVLKGPQGTLFGRNTIGGAISIVTHDPGKEFRFNGDITTGSYNLLQVRATMDVPITNAISSSLSFSVKQRDGYVERIPYPGGIDFNTVPLDGFNAAGYRNIGLGREGGDDTWSFRGKLKWDNGGRLRVVFSGDYLHIDQPQLANSVIKTVPFVFAGTYNCAIVGQVDGCGGGPPSFAFAGGVGGRNSIVDHPGLFGVNIDADPNNNRVPYDDRFLTGNIDKSYATGNNYQRLDNWGIAGTITFDLSDNIQLKSITAYREIGWNVGLDLDGSPLNFLHTSFTTQQYQVSEEVQLLGSLFDKKLNYVLGGYYFNEGGDLHDYVTFAEGLLQVDGPNRLDTTNYAVFGQVDYRFSDLIGITLGGRYTHEDKEFEGFQSDQNGLTYKILQQIGVPPCLDITPITEACRIAAGFPNPGEPLRYYIAGTQKKTFDNFSGKAGIQIHPTDKIMGYFSFSQGYKTGGWTTRLSNPLPYAPDFDEEKAETYEIGVKSTLFDRLLQLNAAVFRTDYDGIQLNFQQGVSPTIQNAGAARIQGFEIEAVVAPTRNFTINGSIGYLDATYTQVDAGAQVTPDPDPVFGRAGVEKGSRLPKTPEWKFNISPRYQFELGNGAKIVVLGDYTHTSSLRNDTEGYFLINRGATDVINASGSYTSPDDRYTITVGGTNITDDRYLVTGQAQFAGGQAYGTYSRPAEWYARVAVRY